MPTVLLALGSNIGDRAAALRDAVQRIAQLPDTTVKAVSPLIETEPVGGPPGQGKYINGAMMIETSLQPYDLLPLLLDIERLLGRDRAREVRNGPRRADIDMLFYEDQIIHTPGLTVPHPRLHERRFVLEPLAQIAPDWIHPERKQTVRDMLANLKESAR